MSIVAPIILRITYLTVAHNILKDHRAQSMAFLLILWLLTRVNAEEGKVLRFLKKLNIP